MGVPLEAVDVTGQQLRLPAPPLRIVSLVPSETESVAALGAFDRLVGRTDFCEEPAGRIEQVPAVGGTKNPRLEDILALRPDLVLANREENPRKVVEALRSAAIPVFVSEPDSPEAALGWLEDVTRLLGLEPEPAPVRRLREALRRFPPPEEGDPLLRLFVPIWEAPTMTFDGRTYASALLERVGAHNVFSDRPRRYPLAADLGRARPRPAAGRDTRYPRVPDEEIVARRPERVWLPDEPYRYGEAEARRYEALLGPAEGGRSRVRFVSGKDLFWYGARSAEAIARLRELAAADLTHSNPVASRQSS